MLLRLYAKGEAPGGAPLAVEAKLGAPGRVLAEASLDGVGPAWRRCELRLVPSAAARDATLAIELLGPGTLWIDRVSLTPEDALPGHWRTDVVAALEDLRPGVLRYGGCSIEVTEWEEGVGPVEERVPFVNAFWGGRDPNNVGLAEFLALCLLVGAEPLVCVRWNGKTPQDAANEVEYVNGAVDTPYGRKRAAHGHPEPYGVRFWQIGNEVAGPEYERTVADFARAMKAVDPSIRLCSAFPSLALVQNASPVLDYLSPHHYGCAALGAMEEDVLALRDLVTRAAGGPPSKLAVTEWSTTAGDWGLGRRALLTLDNALACARYHHLMQRNSDFVEIAIRSNLTNSFCSGILQTRGPDLFLAPTYYA
ncbi:MAG: hypothetical protein AB1726_14380 [Planctomycetota bacterium]